MIILKIGDKAPNFSGIDQDGNKHSLTDYKGKKLIIFFYPKANTPGCTTEACDLRDNYERFQNKNYELIGISPDIQESQAKFKQKYNLPFSLIADGQKEIIKVFGVWGAKKFMGRTYDGVHRTTFIIDEKGIIEDIITKVKTKEHTAQILR